MESIAMAHDIPTIDARQRPRLGTRATQRVRAEGRLPAVIYGHKQDPVHVSLDYKQAVALLLDRAHLLKVSHDGQTESCLVKEVQWDSLGGRVAHVDLERVDLTETVTVEVEVELVGEAVGLKEAGAFIEHPNTSVEISCEAGSIPEVLMLDVSALGVGDALTVADLPLPAGVKAVSDPDTVLAVVHMSRAEDELEAAPAAGAAEPELVGRKDGDEEAEEAAEKK
jgi:large subunit ribosomal protein L25